MRLFLIIPLCLSLFISNAQNNTGEVPNAGKYIGKYEVNGMVVQVALLKQSLVLIVPGAPIQQMVAEEGDRFRTNAFSDEVFLFPEKDGKVINMISQRQGQSLGFNKISDTPDDFDKRDSLLVLKRSREHFIFLYSENDSVTVNQIADKLEKDYRRILNDFNIKELPVTTVRIYPDRASFGRGINFPNAPEELLATAFGKDDFRMISPRARGVDSVMLMKGVTHDFAHCVHLNIDYSPNNPRWLWEGVAMFEAGWFLNPKELGIAEKKDLPALSTLGNGMEYSLGYVIIEAIKDIWGFDTIVGLIRKRGDVEATIHLSGKEFEEKIFEYIYRKYLAVNEEKNIPD